MQKCSKFARACTTTYSQMSHLRIATLQRGVGKLCKRCKRHARLRHGTLEQMKCSRKTCVMQFATNAYVCHIGHPRCTREACACLTTC